MGQAGDGVIGERPLEWGEIYDRLARRSERPDARAWGALRERVRAWTRDAEVAEETCAEVWRTFNLSRGGAAFEGFVQGRLVEVARRYPPPPSPLPLAMERGDGSLAPAPAPLDVERVGRCLEELRARNPRHHRVLTLLSEDRATVVEAADALGVEVWAVRTLAARARMALAQCLERGQARRGAEAGADAGEREGTTGKPPAERAGPMGKRPAQGSGKPARRPGSASGRPSGHRKGQGKGRPPGGGRPR